MNILKHGDAPSVKFECLFCGCEWSADAGEYDASAHTAKRISPERTWERPSGISDIKIVQHCYRTATMDCPECGATMKSRLETIVLDVLDVEED